METKEVLRRSFGGKINNFTDNQERSFEQRHLKAYLKGKKRFIMGRDLNGDQRYFLVKEIWS